MKRAVIFIISLILLGLMGSLEFQSEQSSVDYDHQMRAAAVRCQQLKDAGINPYDY